jgi:hypothetical protein
MFTFDFLTECFLLDEETGTLFWKTRPAWHFADEKIASRTNTHMAGKAAGCPSKERKRFTVKICGRYILCHRIVYALSRQIDLDEVPTVIDHIDGNPGNNRPTNLRPATPRQNAYNRAKQANNTSGFKGVTLDRRTGCWVAKINVGGNDIYLGGFKTVEEAGAAYRGAAIILHGEFFREETQAAA